MCAGPTVAHGIPVGRSIPHMSKSRTYLLALPAEHDALLAVAAARAGVTPRAWLHELVKESVMSDTLSKLVPRTPGARSLTGTYGGPVEISDDVEAEKIQGTLGRRLEAEAAAYGD